MKGQTTLYEWGLRIEGQTQLTDFYGLYASQNPPSMEESQ